MEKSFDLVFENQIKKGEQSPKTISDILFEHLNGRDEDSKIILSHFGNQYIEISLGKLRFIIRSLLLVFTEKKIQKGQTVMLITFSGCNEMIVAIYFLALAVRGCRTFLPMYSVSDEFSDWIDKTDTKHIILPDSEMMGVEGHDREKSEIMEIKNLALSKGIDIWDSLKDFGFSELLMESDEALSVGQKINTGNTSLPSYKDEVLIVTTSGTTGKSKLISYTHEAYYLNCLAWEQAGFYKRELLGGRGFTPLLTHTMGIRALINALWTGSPVCLIITEWFHTKPEIVRYLLLRMHPEHITGGPAVYNTFLELFRQFPELKSNIGQRIKTIISCGAAYDPITAGEMLDATGLYLHNAFGTTETQQVLSTLLSNNSVFKSNRVPLGNPLPGVCIGLIKSEQEPDHFRLFIKSAFGHHRSIGEDESYKDEYYETGDIVSFDGNNCFFFEHRATPDYFKDSFGVKIPFLQVREYYEKLMDHSLHTEIYPLKNWPGLTMLIFIKDTSVPAGLVTDRNILKKFKGIIEEINNHLINGLEPFEFQHRHVCRIALLNQPPPLTGKGTISVKLINSCNGELILRLVDSRNDGTGIETTDTQSQAKDKFTRFLSPKIGALMYSLKLNLRYHRGDRDTLFTYIDGKEVGVLDLTGGYGTNLLGYNNPELSRTVKDFISSGKIAICSQLSLQNTSSLLAEQLSLTIGSETNRNYQVVFGNSGSEAVEIALHHALYEWKNKIDKIKDQQIQMYGSLKTVNIAEIWDRNIRITNETGIRILAVKNSFHGHSTGARSILGNRKKRLKFSNFSNLEAVFIDDREDGCVEKINETIKESFVILERVIQSEGVIKIVPFNLCTIIAAFAEPVLGEGGIREVSKDFLKELSLKEFPLISDEIQCGLGRTGNLPECKFAHYYLFGKALGGGIEKISAVLIDKSRFCNDFNEYYVSTFGNGELAAATGLCTLDQIRKGEFIKGIRESGTYLHNKLSKLRLKYPSVIRDVLGKGLMQAVYFNPECLQGNILLRILYETEKAGYLFAAWLLNRHRIRIFPTLSEPLALRLEPSAFFTSEETDRVILALDELCEILLKKKMYNLFSFLMDDDIFPETGECLHVTEHFEQVLECPHKDAVKVAFLAHFAFPLKEIRMIEPDFEAASDTGLRLLFNRIQLLLEMEPVHLNAINLFHGKVHFSIFLIPLDSAELEFLHKSGERKKIVTKIQKAVDIAASKGAQIISLGGYTSILTNNGLSLSEPLHTKIITGNTLTAASGLINLRNTIEKFPAFNKSNIIAIVGATGNIGQVLSEMLCIQKDICSELILVSRSEKRLDEFISELHSKRDKNINITSSNNLIDIRRADIIIVSSNTNDPIIFSHHINGNKPVLISDLSVPTAVSSTVTEMTNVTTVPFAAYVTLPEDANAVISSYSPKGTVFCCAAEAILLGLEQYNRSLKGKILAEDVAALTDLARKHNFFKCTGTLASFRTSGK